MARNLKWLTLSNYREMLQKPVSRSRIAILSPFDNLVIQRARTQTLFDFDYQIECYVPAKKRKFGYFVLPILWGQQFAGRMDAKIDRKTGILHILNLSIETRQTDDFCRTLSGTLAEFLKFNGGSQINVHYIGLFGESLAAGETARLSRILADPE